MEDLKLALAEVCRQCKTDLQIREAIIALRYELLRRQSVRAREQQSRMDALGY